MAYWDLTKENTAEYLKEKTNLFSDDAKLSVHEIGTGAEEGDGFINYLFRVSDEKSGFSVIVKQAKKHLRVLGEQKGVFVESRNEDEAAIMAIRYAITPEYIPELYFCDRESHAFICEDCGELESIRFGMMKGEMYPNFPFQLGEYLAKSNFYTSELYLEPEEHHKLEARFIQPNMRKVFETSLFLHDETWVEEEGGGSGDEKSIDDPVREAMNEIPWKSREFRTEMLKLRHIHMAKPECLVHGDLHTSNVMADADHLKIIDMEYTYMGPFSGDTGYFLANLIYEYLRWFYMPDHPEDYCARRRENALAAIKGIVLSYNTVFRECFEKDARFTYQGQTEYCDYLLDTWFHEIVGYIGCAIISRIGRNVELPDLDTLENIEDNRDACRIVMKIAEFLIMNRDEISDVDELISCIITIAESAHGILKNNR